MCHPPSAARPNQQILEFEKEKSLRQGLFSARQKYKLDRKSVSEKSLERDARNNQPAQEYEVPVQHKKISHKKKQRRKQILKAAHYHDDDYKEKFQKTL